ncbi:MAG: type II toxin-antitoxin system RelE/ParE family toxin [Candidatus Acidiferrales bacterium]
MKMVGSAHGRPENLQIEVVSTVCPEEGDRGHDLLDAEARAEQRQIDASRAGGVIKQRLARTGQGKSGGYRAVVFFRRGERAYPAEQPHS